MARPAPSDAPSFFAGLTETPFRVSAMIRQAEARDDIGWALADILPARHRADPFYAIWVADMADICRTVCGMLRSETVRFRLDTFRGCQRYHIDNIAFRTIVTYFGAGTEYLLSDGGCRKAYERGAPNEEIVKDPSAIRHINPWTVAVFRGGPNGILHKTPDAAIKSPSVFMRVDPAPEV